MDATALSVFVENSNSQAILSYWDCEIDLAILMENKFSDIEESDKLRRTCAICGTDCGTDENGNAYTRCTNKDCLVLWDFWDLSSMPKPSNFCQKSGHKKRWAFLRSRIVNVFGFSKIYQIPNNLMFDFLLCAMIERIANEAND